jgi:hypothetical protein
MLLLKAAFVLSVKICAIRGKLYFAVGKINYNILWQTPLNFTLCGLTKSSMQN